MNIKHVKTKSPKTEGEKEKHKENHISLTHLLVTCFILSVVRWKRFPVSGIFSSYKSYVARQGKVKSLHIVTGTVCETYTQTRVKEAGKFSFFSVSLFHPRICRICAQLRKQSQFRSRLWCALQTGSVAKMVWRVKTAMGQSVWPSEKGDEWNFSVIYIISRRSSMILLMNTVPQV